MLTRYRRNGIVIASLFMVGWVCYVMYKNSALERLYTQHEFNEDIGKIYVELGQLAQDRRDYPTAITFYKNALQHRLQDVSIHDQLGACLELDQKPDEALRLYAKAMSINQYFSEQRFSGDDGISEEVVPSSDLPAQAGAWHGEPLVGKSIYVYAGAFVQDTLMFCRFLPRLVAAGATVYFRPEESIRELIKQADLGVTVVATIEKARELQVDYYTPITSLMFYLGVGLKDIEPVSYLKQPAKSVRVFPELSPRSCNIGIVWQGDKRDLYDKQRSVSLSMFYDLALLRKVKLYSLQMGDGIEQFKEVPEYIAIVDGAAQAKQLSDLAPLIARLDLIITVDGPVAHLAGAMGKPVWLLTPYVSDWRWLCYAGSTDISWYPQMLMMRQDERCSWAAVFDRIKERIVEKIF